MRTILAAVSFCLALALAPRTARAEATNAPPPANTGMLSHFAWQVGERLVYRLHWGFLPVGTAVGTTEWVQHDGRWLVCIRFRTRTNKAVAKLYPVDDTIESLVDAATFLPVQFTKNISEGSHRYFEVTTFDHTNGVAHWESKLTNEKHDFNIGAETRDLPTFMYFMRAHHYVPGEKEYYEVMADDKVYDLWINVIDKEKLDLPRFGKVQTVKTEPEAFFNGLFVRKGKVSLWISDDPRCLATKIVVSVPVASVRAVLCEVYGPGDDAWIEAMRKTHTQQALKEGE